MSCVCLHARMGGTGYDPPDKVIGMITDLYKNECKLIREYDLVK